MTDLDAAVQAVTKRKLTFKAGDNADADKKVKTTLTPVGTERAILPNDLPGVFMSNEALRNAERDLRKHAAVMLAAADGIALLIGDDPEAAKRALAAAQAQEIALVEREAERKHADREKAKAGDKRAQARVDAITPEEEEGEKEAFKARFARLSTEAQAAAFDGDMVAAAKAVFGDDLITDAGSASTDPLWVCPAHGDGSIRVLTRRSTGKEYRACEACAQFEK